MRLARGAAAQPADGARPLAARVHRDRSANGLALLAGPLVGLTLLFLESSTLPAIDIVSSIVYAAVLPYAAVVQTLLFYDARARRAAWVEADEANAGRRGAGAT